jgi:hypothetical protein
MLRHIFKTLCLTGIVLLYCTTTTEAQEQALSMVCRGASSAFQIDELGRAGDRVKLAINFSPSSTAPSGGSVRKVDPGTCSLYDRTVNGNEPKQIQLSVTFAEAQKLRGELNMPDRFWNFTVTNKRGYFDAHYNKQMLFLRRPK